jgi:excisionase family DNA binding protein
MEILTTKEAARFLKISERTLKRWILEYELPYIQLKKRGKILFNKKEILDWLDKYQEPLPVHLKLQRLKLIHRR